MTEPEGKEDVVTIGSRLPEDTEALMEENGWEEAMDKVKTNAESTEDGEGNEGGEATKDGECKKDNKENDVRRQECVEAQEGRRNEYVGMAEYGKENNGEKTRIKWGKEDGAGEMGEGNNVRRGERVDQIEKMEREYVAMAEAGKEVCEEKTLIKEGKEDGAGEMGEGNDEIMEERVEQIEKMEWEDVCLAEADKGDHVEKSVMEGDTVDRGDEMGEDNHVRREVTVEENDEREREDDVEKKTALNGGKYNEGDEASKENDSRREDSVEGEERKREVVDMVGAIKEAEIAREGSEEDAEEVCEENNVTEEVDDEDGEEMGEENNLTEEDESDDGEEKTDESIEANRLKKKSAYGEEAKEKGYKKGGKPRGSKGQESPRMLATSAVQRPLRERKSVKRLVEVINKVPYKKFVIAKGRGIPLRDIANVSYKLARKKPGDLKLLHQILFGRRDKAANFENHILQFSGFACNENDRGKVKERLEKSAKDELLDICDLFNIPVLKSTTRKEDIVVKLLEFMEAPHAATDAIIAEKDERSSQSTKQKRVFEETTSKNISGMLEKGPRKKRVRCEPTTAQTTKSSEETNEDNGEDNSRDIESSCPEEGKLYALSDSDGSESGAEETYEEEDGHLKNGSSTARRRLKTLSFKHHSRKKINVDSTTKKSSSKPDKKQRSTGKGKTGFGPSNEELRKWICEILNKVDFNTVTFNDIFEQLTAYYKMDRIPKKSTMKRMIQKELNKLVRETVENDEHDEGTTFKNVGGMIAKDSRKDYGNNVGVKALSKRKKNVDAPKQKSTVKAKSGCGPNWEEMRKMTCEILKRIDFRTGTVKDIVIELGSYFKMDLMPEKSAIKVMIEEELTRLAEVAVENEDGEDELIEGTTSKICGRKLGKGPRKKRGMRELTATKRKSTELAEDNEKETDEHMKNGNRDLSGYSKHQSEERKDLQEKVFSRRKKKVDASEKKSSSKADRMERSSVKAKSVCGPSWEEMREMICEILKHIDFRTGTVKDIIIELSSYFKMDLMPEKSAIKVMIEEELTRLAEEAVENEDDEDELVEGTISKFFGRKLAKGPRKKRDMRELTATKRKRTEEAEDNKKEADERMKNGKRDLSRSSKHQSEERKDLQEKVFSRRKKKVDAPEKKSSSKPDRTERSSGKRPSRSKGEEVSGPSNKELRMTICEILQAVDFNTTTFGEVIKQITDSYKMDLTSKMETIKSMIKNELRRLKVNAEKEEVAAKSSGRRMKV